MCGFSCDSNSDTTTTENMGTSYVFELDISKFTQLGDSVMSDFRWDDELHQAHPFRAYD